MAIGSDTSVGCQTSVSRFPAYSIYTNTREDKNTTGSVGHDVQLGYCREIGSSKQVREPAQGASSRYWIIFIVLEALWPKSRRHEDIEDIEDTKEARLRYESDYYVTTPANHMHRVSSTGLPELPASVVLVPARFDSKSSPPALLTTAAVHLCYPTSAGTSNNRFRPSTRRPAALAGLISRTTT